MLLMTYGKRVLGRRPVLALAPIWFAIGCASPGIPRAPSLNLPEAARDLAAVRTGDSVELRFTAPTSSTDKIALRGGVVTAIFCRQLDHEECIPVASSRTSRSITAQGPFVWVDDLPPNLARGNTQLLGYRVEIFNANRRSAGNSPPAFIAAGNAPDSVKGLRIEGSRLGPVISWNASSSDAGTVILEREENAARLPSNKKLKESSVHLTNPEGFQGGRLLDTTAVVEKSYRYTAVRQVSVQIGGRSLTIHSARSPTVDYTLHAIYPPADPTGLIAVPYGHNNLSAPSFAVDLIWQPVNDSGLITPFAGYLIYRESIDSMGHPVDQRTRLNAVVLGGPAFHDATADPKLGYRYSVTAVDSKGNESGAAVVVVEPTGN
jgi:hypothetical protein